MIEISFVIRQKSPETTQVGHTADFTEATEHEHELKKRIMEAVYSALRASADAFTKADFDDKEQGTAVINGLRAGPVNDPRKA